MKAAEQKKNYNEELVLSPHPDWAQRFRDDLVALKDRVAGRAVFLRMGEKRRSLEDCHSPVMTR